MNNNRNNDALPNGAYTDFSKETSYSDILRLDKLLKLQDTIGSEHDVQLFLIIHQTSELWLKLVLHELHSARIDLSAARIEPTLKKIARCKQIFDQLISAWGVLATMTPTDYLEFRDKLGRSSGFQSVQYRELEFLLGNRKIAMLAPHRHRPDLLARLETELSQPSLYDQTLLLLRQQGFKIDAAVCERDWRQSHCSDVSVLAAWEYIYRHPQQHWELYNLAEKLIDMEDLFQQWRFRHLMTVARFIGFKRGTGGTAGVDYLKKALDYVLFPELWEVRTRL